jgi:hypothetical protein
MFRLSIPFVVMAVISMVIVILIHRQLLGMLSDMAEAMNENLAFIAMFKDIVSSIMFTGIIGISVLSVVCFILWVVYSHRIFGPIVPIRRHIISLKNGDYSVRIKLRTGDEMKDVAEELNQLAEALQVLKNQGGQSIIQVMMAAVIMGILFIAMASMQSNQVRENRALSEKLGALDLQKTLSSALADGTVCSYVLTHPVATITPAALPQKIPIAPAIYASITSAGAPGPIFVQAGSQPSAFASTLVVKDMNLTVTSGSGTSYLGSVYINFQESKLIRAMKPASAGVIVTVDASNNVTSCVGGGSTASSCWQLVGTNLYETCATNVGIGTTTPNNLLTVGGGAEGNAFGVDISGDILVTGGADSNWGLYKVDASGNPNGVMGINSANQASFAGNVGIGVAAPAAKLDVNGEIKLGNLGLPCPPNAGAIRYNSGSSIMEFCDGTAWKPFAAAGGGLSSCRICVTYLGGAGPVNVCTLYSSGNTLQGPVGANHNLTGASIQCQ